MIETDELMKLIFLAILVPLLSVVAHRAAAVDLKTPSVASITGGKVESIVMELGDLFSDSEVDFEQFQSLRFTDLNDDETVVAEIGSCQVAGIGSSHLSLQIDGAKMRAGREFRPNGFNLSIKGFLPDEIQGSFVCSGGELRAGNTGARLMRLEIVGMVFRRPRWVDRSGRRLRQVWFSFDNLIASKQPNLPIESKPIEIKLIHAKSYPAGVLYQSPKGCKIGQVSFPSQYLNIKVDSREVQDGGYFEWQCACSRRLHLRIAAQAAMADKSGIVGCAQSGEFTYTY